MGPAGAAALMVAGTAIQGYGSFMSYQGSKKAESLRKRQANLEATRQRREQLRKAQVARAQATAAAYNQGAGESSALSGGTSQITSQATRNIQGINQDLDVSKGIFNANAQKAQGEFITSIGGGVSDLGSALNSLSQSPSSAPVPA